MILFLTCKKKMYNLRKHVIFLASLADFFSLFNKNGQNSRILFTYI